MKSSQKLLDLDREKNQKQRSIRHYLSPKKPKEVEKIVEVKEIENLQKEIPESPELTVDNTQESQGGIQEPKIPENSQQVSQEIATEPIIETNQQDSDTEFMGGTLKRKKRSSLPSDCDISPIKKLEEIPEQPSKEQKKETEEEEKEAPKIPKKAKTPKKRATKKKTTKKPTKKQKKEKEATQEEKTEEKEMIETDVKVFVDLTPSQENDGFTNPDFKITIFESVDEKTPKEKKIEDDDIFDEVLSGAGNISIVNTTHEEIDLADLKKEMKEREAQRKIREKGFQEIEAMGKADIEYPVLEEEKTEKKIEKEYCLFPKDFRINVNKDITEFSKTELLENVAYNDGLALPSFLEVKDKKISWKEIEDVLYKFGYNGELIETTKEFKYENQQMFRIHLMLQLIKSSVTKENSLSIFKFVYYALQDKRLKFLFDFKEILNIAVINSESCELLSDTFIGNLPLNLHTLNIISSLTFTDKCLQIQEDFCIHFFKKYCLSEKEIDILKYILAIFSRKVEEVKIQNFEDCYIILRLFEIRFVYWNIEIDQNTFVLLEKLETQLKKFSNVFSYFKLMVTEILGKMRIFK